MNHEILKSILVIFMDSSTKIESQQMKFYIVNNPFVCFCIVYIVQSIIIIKVVLCCYYFLSLSFNPITVFGRLMLTLWAAGS